MAANMIVNEIVTVSDKRYNKTSISEFRLRTKRRTFIFIKFEIVLIAA